MLSVGLLAAVRREGGGVGVAAAGRYYRWGRLRLPPQVATLSTRSVLPRPRAHTRPRPAATVRPLHPTPSNRINPVHLDTLCSTSISDRDLSVVVIHGSSVVHVLRRPNVLVDLRAHLGVPATR